MSTNLALLLFIGLVAAIVIWGVRRPYKFQHGGATYYRLPGGKFVDARKKPVTDSTLISALNASYESRKAEDNAEASKWGSQPTATERIRRAEAARPGRVRALLTTR